MYGTYMAHFSRDRSVPTSVTVSLGAVLMLSLLHRVLQHFQNCRVLRLIPRSVIANVVEFLRCFSRIVDLKFR